MKEFTVTHPVELIESLMSEFGYATRTKARNALKRGDILVNGKPEIKGQLVLEPGAKVVVLTGEEKGQLSRTGGAVKPNRGRSNLTSTLKAPFPVVYEDANVFVYEKPAGWVCASPNPKVKTSYTAVKAYLESKTEEHIDVHFVNKLPREASGLLVVTKSREWRDHLQTHWSSFDKGLYLMIEGHLPADDALFIRPETGDSYELAYRTMRATDKHTMLKMKVGYEAIKDLLPALRREDCLLVGVGKAAPDPMKRGGIHLFALALKGPDESIINVKTRVPQEFLKLVKGGTSPKPIKARTERRVAAPRGEARKPRPQGRKK